MYKQYYDTSTDSSIKLNTKTSIKNYTCLLMKNEMTVAG